MTDEELRKQAWNFFQMQAGQRLTTFNFYIAISSLLSTGLVATFKTDIDLPSISRICIRTAAHLLFLYFLEAGSKEC